MIADLKDVTGQALKDQIKFLGGTPVAEAASWLAAGVVQLRRGRIKSVAALGDLSSIFSNLDKIVAKKEVGLEKFQVKHVRAVLLDDRCGDDQSRDRLKQIEAGLLDGSIEPNITIYDGQVIDGNKTAAAYYHIHRNDPSLALPVFVIVET